MMNYRIRHTTEYRYQEPVSTGHNRLCLTPLTLSRQRCISTDIKISPLPDELTYSKDFFGNTLLFVSIYKEHEVLKIFSDSMLEMEDRDLPIQAAASMVKWEQVTELLRTDPSQYADLIQYTMPSLYIPYSQPIRDFALDCFTPGASLWEASMLLMGKIFNTIEFKPGFTTVNTPVESIIQTRKGVCQDIAHLMIACLRNMGLPARYVSGYIETLPPPGKEKLVGSDASHAWVAIYFPQIGWVEFDPTNNHLPSHMHITVAFGRDYFDVAPIKGIIFSSGSQAIDVKVDVNRLS